MVQAIEEHLNSVNCTQTSILTGNRPVPRKSKIAYSIVDRKYE